APSASDSMACTSPAVVSGPSFSTARRTISSSFGNTVVVLRFSLPQTLLYRVNPFGLDAQPYSRRARGHPGRSCMSMRFIWMLLGLFHGRMLITSCMVPKVQKNLICLHQSLKNVWRMCHSFIGLCAELVLGVVSLDTGLLGHLAPFMRVIRRRGHAITEW